MVTCLQQLSSYFEKAHRYKENFSTEQVLCVCSVRSIDLSRYLEERIISIVFVSRLIGTALFVYYYSLISTKFSFTKNFPHLRIFKNNITTLNL